MSSKINFNTLRKHCSNLTEDRSAGIGDSRELFRITNMLKSGDFNLERMMQAAESIPMIGVDFEVASLMGDIEIDDEEFDALTGAVSERRYRRKPINYGFICFCDESAPAPVLKIIALDRVNALSYLKEVAFHYSLKNRKDDILSRMTIDIYETYLMRTIYRDLFFIAMEYERADCSMADKIEDESYPDAERIKHIEELEEYFCELHALDDGRAWHGDLKPENLLFIGDQLKISDLEESAGTPQYIIPHDLFVNELNQIDTSGDLSKERDLFSFKMLLIELLLHKRYLPVILEKNHNFQNNVRSLVSYLKGDHWDLPKKDYLGRYTESLLQKRREELNDYER